MLKSFSNPLESEWWCECVRDAYTAQCVGVEHLTAFSTYNEFVLLSFSLQSGFENSKTQAKHVSDVSEA